MGEMQFWSHLRSSAAHAQAAQWPADHPEAVSNWGTHDKQQQICAGLSQELSHASFMWAHTCLYDVGLSGC